MNEFELTPCFGCHFADRCLLQSADCYARFLESLPLDKRLALMGIVSDTGAIACREDCEIVEMAIAEQSLMEQLYCLRVDFDNNVRQLTLF